MMILTLVTGNKFSIKGADCDVFVRINMMKSIALIIAFVAISGEAQIDSLFCTPSGNDIILDADNPCTCITSPGFQCGIGYVPENLAWTVLPNTQCSGFSITFVGDNFDVAGDPTNNCQGADVVRVIQNRRFDRGGRLKELRCGLGQDAATITPIISADTSKPIWVTFEAMSSPLEYGLGFAAEICATGC